MEENKDRECAVRRVYSIFQRRNVVVVIKVGLEISGLYNSHHLCVVFRHLSI